MNSDKKALILGASASVISGLVEVLAEAEFELHTSSTVSLLPSRASINYRLDMNDQDSILRFLEQIQELKFDLILSAVGITSGIAIEVDSLEHIEFVTRVNQSSQIWLLPRLFDFLKEDGVLSYIGSSAAEGESFDLTYSANKAGLRAAVKSFFATRNLGRKKIYIFEPSLVEDSKMFREMTNSNVSIHRKKWGGKPFASGGYQNENYGGPSR